jgi:BASS family bile acid:Na+ symporter
MITLFEMMVAIGLGVTFGTVLDVARNWRLITRAALANYIVVPATAVGLLLLFDAHPMIAAGFVVAAVCPGAPYGPLFTAIARGDVPVAVGLMVVLAGSSALISPALLYVLLAPLFRK